MSFVVFRELAKAYEPHWKLENETSPAFVPSCIPPAMSQRESLEKVLNEIAEAPVQDLSTCSSQLLQKVRDKVSIIISQDQATESASRYSGPQAAQACISVINGPPAPGPSAPGPSAEGFDANKKANALVNTLLKNLDHVSKFVTRDVGEILRDGIRQSHEDPRIEDVGRMVKPTEFDELRFVLGSLSLSDDYDRFKLGTGKTTKHSSQRAFGATCGIKDCHKLRHGLDFGKKIRKLVLDYGNGIIAFLVFVKWHIAKEEDLVRFGRLCVTEKKIKHLIPTTADFITRCLDVYRTVVQERRIGIAKQPVQRKRKRPTTLARPHHANGNQQSRRCTPGLPVGPNATDQHLSVATEKIPTGKSRLISTSRPCLTLSSQDAEISERELCELTALQLQQETPTPISIHQRPEQGIYSEGVLLILASIRPEPQKMIALKWHHSTPTFIGRSQKPIASKWHHLTLVSMRLGSLEVSTFSTPGPIRQEPCR